MTIGVTAKPLPNTTITVNHESYSLGTNASSLMWGFNSNALRWAAAGKPTIEFRNPGVTWLHLRGGRGIRGHKGDGENQKRDDHLASPERAQSISPG
jgi:hypothetical protein